MAALFASAADPGYKPPDTTEPDADADFPVRTCLILALATGLLGLALRLALPVLPADTAFREVVRHYGADRPPGESGNMRETSRPY